MKRERATKILTRILQTVDSLSGESPIREVFVFGSYAEGALNPGDIDLVIVHDPVTDELRERLEHEAKSKRLNHIDELYYPVVRYQAMIKKPLRRPGESVDILLDTSFEGILSQYSTLADSRFVLLWSRDDRNWEQKWHRSVPMLRRAAPIDRSFSRASGSAAPSKPCVSSQRGSRSAC